LFLTIKLPQKIGKIFVIDNWSIKEREGNLLLPASSYAYDARVANSILKSQVFRSLQIT